MYKQPTKNTATPAAARSDVKKASESATPSHAATNATAAATSPSQTAASSPTVPRHITTELHCQAVVVRVGEKFAEFECDIYRHTRANESAATGQKTLMASSLQNGLYAALSSNAAAAATASSASSPRAAADEIGVDSPRRLHSSSSPLSPAPSPSTRAEKNNSGELDDLVPVDCTEKDVPRWQLLIYTFLHNGQGVVKNGSRRHPLPVDTSTNTVTTTTATARPTATTAVGGSVAGGGGGEAKEPTSLDELPLPDNAKVCFFQTLPTSKLSKVVKLDPGCRFTIQVRCYSRPTAQWSPWSEPVQTVTQFPVVTRIVEIGSDYVHCTWDRAAQRSEEGIAKEVDTETTNWCRGIPNFELRFLRESDMAEHYLGSFEAGCRSQTVRSLQPGTAYIVMMRYMTMIHTMREWTEVTRLVTESPLEVRLESRGEDTFTFSWSRSTNGDGVTAGTISAANAEPSATAFLEDGGDSTAAATASVAGYLLPRVPVHEYELIVQSAGLRFDPITVPASVDHYTMDHVYPSTTYSVSVRALSEEGRWGGRSLPLVVRTADLPTVAVAAVGESFASFTWSRKQEEVLESQVQYRVQSVTSAYSQAETITLTPAGGAPLRRLLNVEHLRAGSQYTITLRVAIGAAWGAWTEPLRFTTAPSVALTFLERGEDFLTLNWPSAELTTSRSGTADEAPVIYNIVVVKCGALGERTAVLNERVTRDATQRGFRVSDLEANTTYEVQCRTWQRNPMTGFEGWGEFSAPVRVQTLQPVALHVWDVGEDFIHVVWRRGLSEQGGGDPNNDSTSTAAAATSDWDRLKYEVVVGCVDTGEDELLHRQVLDTSFTISQLKPSTTYVISVRACDEQGQWGLWSRVKVLTLASVKTTINEIGEDFVRLVWQRCGADDNADLHDVTVADMFVAKYSVLVYAKELPGIPVVPHGPSGYEEGGGRSDVVRHEIVSSEHTSLRIGDLLPDREYVAVVRAATSSGRWGLWSRPTRFRTNPQFRIPAQQLTIGENYVSVVWSRGEPRSAADADDAEVLRGDLTVTGQELRIRGVTTQYVKEYALEPDVRELKMSELLPACAYTIQIRVRGRSGCWGLWSSPVHILTRGTIAVTTDEVAEDFIVVRWERRKVSNPHQFPTGRGIVTSYHLRVYNGDGVHMETFLGDGDCPYRVTGLKTNTYYCVELKANYNDEEWGLWSVPLWCLTMQPMRIQAKLISEEFCCLQLARPNQQRRLPEDDGNPPTEERVLAHGRVRPTIMLCVTSPILSKAPYSTSTVSPSSVPAGAPQAKPAYLNDALPPDAADQRLVYQTELLNSAETVEHTVPNLKCNTVYSVSVRTKLANGEWGMWSPSLVFATVPATRVSFTSIGESFVGVEWVRHAQVIPPQIASPERVVLGVATITASRVRVRESGGAYQHTYTVEGSTTSLRVDHLSPATTYMVCVQTFNDNYEWGVWSEEQKVRTVPGMDIHIQNVSEDALWVSWSRKTDLHVGGDADTVFNVNISARVFEVCILGEGGFTYTQETTSTALFFRGLLPDVVYTVHVRALFGQSDHWGLWSTQAFRTKPRLRITFGNIGDHFVMLEWRRHLPKPTETELRLTAVEGEEDGNNDNSTIKRTRASLAGVLGGATDGPAGRSTEHGALVPVGEMEGLTLSTTPATTGSGVGPSGGGAVSAVAMHAGPPLSIAETEDVVQLYRFKVQRIGEAHALIYNIAPTVSSFRLRDLLPSSEYRVWVCAKGYEGVWGFWSEESRVRTLPRLQLTVQNIGEDYVRATWRRGAWEGESMAAEGGTEVRQVDGAVSGYEVRVLDTQGEVAATTTTTFREAGITLTGLQLSSLYSIQVRAKDTYDTWGLWSDPVSFYTLRPVTVGLQRVGESFAAVHWSRNAPPLPPHHRSTDAEDDLMAFPTQSAASAGAGAGAGAEAEGVHADDRGVLHPDERVTRWHMRVSCNRIFAGMPQSEDYRELYVGEGESMLQVDGLLPYATYSIAVRGLNHAGEWGHWSPPLYVTTCPLLKVGVEMAGETFLQVAWQRPAARVGVTEWATPQENIGRARSPHSSSNAAAHEYYNLNDLSYNNSSNNASSMPVSENNSRTRRFVSGTNPLGDDDGMEDSGADNSLSDSLSSAAQESYLCFPSESEVHNYQVTIRPMPTEPAFDESDEPLVDGARVYETTQPGLRLGNLLPGCRYAVTVREQQISEDGRPIAGVWGAPSEVVCTSTVPPVQIIPQEIGEDYCLVEWHRAVVADTAEDALALLGSTTTAKDGKDALSSAPPVKTVLAVATTAGRRAVEFQLQTRRLDPDGVTLYKGPFSLDSVVSVPSSVSTYHIPNLVPSSVYEVRVRAKIEGGQWGIWSLATRFLTQSRLELRVDMVQEVAVRLSWSRTRAHVMAGSDDDKDEKRADGERPLAATSAEHEAAADAVGKSVTVTTNTTTTAPSEIAVAAHVILPVNTVREYEVVLEGISCEEHRRLTFAQDTQTAFVEDLQQDQLYCVSVRSLSEQQHWSHFSPKVTVLTLASVQVRVAQYTEATALLEWDRPLPDVARFSDLLSRQQREALQQCDERERRELFELKRRLQEQESKGEAGGTAARWLDSAAREEHNALLREEATLHYQMDRIVVGHADSTGYELRVFLQDGTVCLPFIEEVERLRLRPSRMSRVASTRDLLGTSRRPGPGTPATRGYFNSAMANNVGIRERKKEVTLKTTSTPTGQSVTLLTTSGASGSTAAAASSATATAGSAPQQDASVELLDVQLQPSVTQVLLRGLSPNSTFAATVRGRSGPEMWQPWSVPTRLATLALIQLDQSRFGEHYINLYWYREEAAKMAATVREMEEYRRLQHEFHNFTERDLENQRGKLDAAEYTSLVNRLRRLRALRRVATARARRHAEGELGLLADPNCPIQGFQLRVIDEAGTISEHYLPNDAAKPTLSFTETGLQPNNMYVCRLCPHYGGDVWGCWTAPLKYMTHNLIQLDLTYISETFVDLEWWRLDNKEVAKMDVNDTLLSSRYTEEVQVYQLRITHEDAASGTEVEEFRDMQAANVLRIDALLPDTKYTIAVREWDAKGDWGLWSAPCSCVTLPSMETVVTEVKEDSAHVSWSRAAPRIDYGSDMHVLEGNVEITGFYLRLEEIPVHTRASAVAATDAAATAEGTNGTDKTLRPNQPLSNALESNDGGSSDSVESAGALSMDLDDTRLVNTSFHGVPAVASGEEEKPRAAAAGAVDELEGTLAFSLQRGGPLPPEQHPQVFEGLVPNCNAADKSSFSFGSISSKLRQHYLLVRKIASSAELQTALTDLNPQTIYCVQVMAETTGGQVGPWSAPHHFITMPRIRLSPASIYEHYATLEWGRVALAPLATLVTNSGNNSSSNTSSGGAGGNGGHRSSWSASDGTGRKVTLPTSRVVAYELEVCGVGSDFTLSTRIETNAATSTFRVTGLALDSLYTARVRSFNEAGEASLWSSERTFVTLRQLLVHPNEITENHIDVEWGRPEQNPESYHLKIAQRADKEELIGASASARPTTAGPAAAANAVVGKNNNTNNAGANSISALPLTFTPIGSTTSTTVGAATLHDVPAVSVGVRDAVKYHLRVYHATEDAPPRLFLEKHLNGNVLALTVNSLSPNAIYILYVRAINHDGVWSEWSEGRCVYTMKPLVSSIATVGEDFVRLQWSRDAPEEVHYAPNTASTNGTGEGAAASTAAKDAQERRNDSDAAVGSSSSSAGGPERSSVLAHECGGGDDGSSSPLGSDGALATTTACDSPGASQRWQRQRRFLLQDKPAGEVGPVYRSAATSILAYVISVRRSEEAEGYTVEVPGDVHQHTVPALQPDSIYLVSVRAKYGSGEWSPWSDVVRTGTYNLLATDVKEVGEDYFAAAWQRKSNTINMGSLHIGKVEETVCYEVRVRDYSDVPLGEEEGEVARQREEESRSLFLHPNQRYCVMRELQSNHRYRLAVRRWYQPLQGFAHVDDSGDGGLQLPGSGSDGGKTTIDPVLRESIEKARAAPGVWSGSEYIVTLRGMVCTVERVGEEFFQLRWARDPYAVPLPVRRAMLVKPVQTYQLRIDEMLRDGSAVETTRGSNTLHLDELMPPTETTYFNKSLKPNTLYKIEVRCCIEKTWGQWSRPVYIITLPCLQVELSRIGEECATITWRRPREPLTLPDGEVAVLGDEEDTDGTYQVEVSGVGFSYQVSKHFKASRSTYTVRHLDADALYSVRVRWGDSVNQAWSLWSDMACFATLKPLQVKLSTPTEHFVDVEWSRPKQTAEEYMALIEKQQNGSTASPAPASAPSQQTPPAPSPPLSQDATPRHDATLTSPAEQPELARVGSHRSSLASSSTVASVQLGNPGSLAFHLCVFNTQETPSVAVVDKQFHKDVSSYRVNGLNADTPYVVIIRACCEATGDWGLWSDERPFRTLKLLAPTVSGVGENYAELTWEQGEGAEQQQHRAAEAAGAVNSASAMPTKYLIVLHSASFGTVEREITAEECGVPQDKYQALCYRLTQLQPGTEYAVALQPCYGGAGDWGLWSQAVLFTTLQTLQLTATVRSNAADLSWCRQSPPRAVEIADPATDGQTADVTGGGGGDYVAAAAAAAGATLASPAAILLPTTGGVNSAAGGNAAPLGSTRTVSHYQFMMCREADFVALCQQHASLEGSTSSSSLTPALAAESRSPMDHAPHSRRTSLLNASLLQEGNRESAKHGLHSSTTGTKPSKPSSSSGNRRGSADTSGAVAAAAAAAGAGAQTTIPDMDMAALASLESPGAVATNPSIFLFRKTYDMTDTNTTPAAGTAASKNAGNRTNMGNMVEHVEGLTPDTVYIARVRAMDLFGHWGAFVEQRVITPPLPPSQVVLRRVNAQFCSLQWVSPAATAAAAAATAITTELTDAAAANTRNGSTNVNTHSSAAGLTPAEAAAAAHYRYVIEQCFVATDAVGAVYNNGGNNNGSGPAGAGAGSGAAGGSAGASRRGGGGSSAGPAGANGGNLSTSTAGLDWHVVDTVEDSTVCAVRLSGLLTRLRCRVKCARRHTTRPAPPSDDDNAATPLPQNFLGPYSEYSEVVGVSSGTPPEGVQDLHLTILSQNTATLEWLPPPKPSEAAAGRYTRPHYRVYLANTTDQPYPVLLTTVHRPTYALTNLTPGTAYTVQVVAENNDGVSFRNPILLFHTKAEDDATVSRHEEGGGGKEAGAATGAAPLGEIVAFHGPRAVQQAEEDGAAFAGGDELDNVADIPTAPRRLLSGSPPQSSAVQRGSRSGRSGAAGRTRGAVRESLKSTADSASRPATSPQRRNSKKRPSAFTERSRSTSVKEKSKAKGDNTAAVSQSSSGKRKKSSTAAAMTTQEQRASTTKMQGNLLPPLSRTM